MPDTSLYPVLADLATRHLPHSPEWTALLQAAQIVRTLEDANFDFKVQPVLSSDGVGLLDVVWCGQMAQIGSMRAREIAWILLEAAAHADAEGALMRFLQASVDAAPDHAIAFIRDFRRFRDDAEHASSLVGQKADG